MPWKNWNNTDRLAKFYNGHFKLTSVLFLFLFAKRLRPFLTPCSERSDDRLSMRIDWPVLSTVFCARQIAYEADGDFKFFKSRRNNLVSQRTGLRKCANHINLSLHQATTNFDNFATNILSNIFFTIECFRNLDKFG